MLTEVKHRDFRGGHPSWYYSSLSALNYEVSSMVKPTLLATPFAKPSTNVAPYEPFIRDGFGETLLMKYGSMSSTQNLKVTQLNLDNNITI